jgi:hypothetical protein
LKATVYKTSAGVLLGVREEIDGVLVRTFCGDCELWLGGDGGDHFSTATHKMAERMAWPAGSPRTVVVEIQEGGRVISDSVSRRLH